MRPQPAAEAPRGQEPAPDGSWRGRDWLVGLLLLAATLIAYRPVWHAGFIWDDKGHVTRPDLQPLHGLWRIWFEPGATQQYYPLLHSAFWLEHRLWGDAASAYHLANLGLHALAAFLLYVLLRRLSLPGALLAAAVFALHPVCVESVAWISEQKNTLSAVFCLGSAVAYLSFDRGRKAGPYLAALALFACAVATKSVTATLPAALLVILWWKRGRLSLKADVLPLLPWFALAAAAGFVTAFVERRFIGASGEAFALGPGGRVIVAGRALWFYLGKIFWPAHLSFIYPHWDVAAAGASQYLIPAAAAAVVLLLFALRERMRGPLAAALLFCGLLFPALGFINVYPFIYSYVADHFQYLALAAVVAAASAGLTLLSRRLSKAATVATGGMAGCLVALLALHTTAQCRIYVDSATLWQATLAQNPSCWMAYQNLGGVFLAQGRVSEAIEQFERAIALRPTDHEALNELGVAQLQAGQTALAEETLRRALAFAPNSSETHLNLGVALLRESKPEEAAREFEGVIDVDPSNTQARRNLALALRDSAGSLFLQGRAAESAATFGRSLDMAPDDAQSLSGLGAALAAEGRADDAVFQFRRALAIDPTLLVATTNLGASLMKLGRFDEAAAAFKRALELEPADARLCNNLGIALAKAGHLQEAAAQFQRAVDLDPAYIAARRNLNAIRRAPGAR